MKALCILLGANTGTKPEYIQAVRQLAEIISKKNINLIYGGGKLGLMEILANTTLEYGGHVTGVITKNLYEVEAHPNLSDLIVVDSMQQRKKIMMELSDGFIALPGGLGTLEEIFEIWNASKLNLHQKPIGLLNIQKYYNKLIDFINYSSQQGFLKDAHKNLVHIHENPGDLLDLISKQISCNQVFL